MRRSLAYVTLFLLAGACGDAEDLTTPPAQAPPSEPVASTAMESPVLTMVPRNSGPPPIRVSGAGHELVLSPWSSCWRAPTYSVCSDGRPPESPPHIGDPSELEVEFPVPDWRFTATAARAGVACGREQSVELAATSPTTYRLVPIGPAGDYTITLFGRAKEGAVQAGDVAATFGWHTPRAGPNEAPAATVSVIGGNPTEPRSFGVELTARALGMSTQTGTVDASVAVTSVNGASMSIDLEPRPAGDCVPEGTLYLGAPEEAGKEAAALGPAPFRYDVTLLLDGIPYRGTGTWPDGQRSECSPCTTLRFDPPLPAL